MEPINKNKTSNPNIEEPSGFFQTGRQTYYVNSSEILTVDHILSIGKNYILLNANLEEGLKAYFITLTSVRFINAGVHLHLQDNQKHGNYLLRIPFQPDAPETTFCLLDVETLVIDLNVHFINRKNEIIEKISKVEPFLSGWERIIKIIWEEAASVINGK